MEAEVSPLLEVESALQAALVGAVAAGLSIHLPGLFPVLRHHCLAHVTHDIQGFSQTLQVVPEGHSHHPPISLSSLCMSFRSLFLKSSSCSACHLNKSNMLLIHNFVMLVRKIMVLAERLLQNSLCKGFVAMLPPFPAKGEECFWVHVSDHH